MSQPPIARAVDAARQAEANRDPTALTLWEAVVRLDPGHFIAWSKIGVMQAGLGNLDKSVAAFEAAVRASPFHAVLHFNLARAYFSSNRPVDAVGSYQAAIQLAPDYLDAYLGWIEALGVDAPAAEILAVCERASAGGARHPILQGEQGRQLIRLHRANEAVDILQDAVRHSVAHCALHSLHSAALLEAGRPEEALVSAERALSIEPGNKDARLARAAALVTLNRMEEALEEMPEMAAKYPDDAATLRVYGIALAKQHRFNESVVPLTESANLDGRRIDVWEALGTALGALHQPASAAECFRRADVVLTEDAADKELRLRVLNQRLNFLSEGQLFDDVVKCCEQVGELSDNPAFVVGRQTYALAMLADWSRLRDSRQKLEEVARLGRGDCTPFSLLAFFDDPELHRDYAASHTRIGWGLIERQRLLARSRVAGAPLRVGYLSPDFRDHPVGRLIVALLENHDRAVVEPIALSTWLTAKDVPESMITQRIRAATAEYIELGELNDEDAARRIREADLDVLVDLCGHTLGSRLGIFARGCAPLQIQYLGHPGTTGATFFDAVIADSHVIPEGADPFYTERVVRLKRSYLPPGDRPALIHADHRAAYGLPENAVVLGAFHSTYKISPESFAAWMHVLGRCADAVLWLNVHDAPARAALTAHAVAAGIDPARVIFADREPDIERHLSRMTHIDLMLDTYPYGSHSAALDALWAGVPILVQEGRSFASRVCAGLLRELDLPSLVTSSLERYTSRAIELMENGGELRGLREQLLAQRAHPIFDARAHAQDLESALVEFARAQPTV